MSPVSGVIREADHFQGREGNNTYDDMGRSMEFPSGSENMAWNQRNVCGITGDPRVTTVKVVVADKCNSEEVAKGSRKSERE